MFSLLSLSFLNEHVNLIYEMNVLCSWNIQVFFSFSLKLQCVKGCVCMCLCVIESGSECHSWPMRAFTSLLCVLLVWIVKAVVSKYISRRQKKGVGYQDQKDHILYSLLLQHCWLNLPPQMSINVLTVFGKCLVLFCAPGVCEHNDTSTLSLLE